MQRPIDQINALKEKYRCPIIFTGDLFDRWKATPELINWAIKRLPTMYAIPGQHDLPYHRYEDIRKSAFWTLVETGHLINLLPREPYPVNSELTVYGFPWGSDVTPLKHKPLAGKTVAVVHAYCWTDKTGYPNAPEDKRLKTWLRKLTGYDFACFGDQHKTILHVDDSIAMVNTGTLLRRKSDEAKHKPCVGLLWSDGDVTVKYLATDDDKTLSPEGLSKAKADAIIDVEDLLDVIAHLKGIPRSYKDAVKELMERVGISKEVHTRVMEAVESDER